jgi:hypothetical protein
MDTCGVGCFVLVSMWLDVNILRSEEFLGEPT